MASVLSNITLILLLSVGTALASEISDFHAVQNAFRNNSANKHDLAKTFFSKYPRSNHVPDIRMLIAKSSNDIDDSISEYEKIIRLYRHYNKRDAAFFALCQLHYVKRDWRSLFATSNHAISESANSGYLPIFYHFRAIAHYKHSNYEEGIEDCKKIPEFTRELNTLAYGLFLKNEMQRQMYGYSKYYIQGLAELLYGYNDSFIYPALLLQLGRYYEHNNMINHAWSAYDHIILNYPKAPEALIAKHSISALQRYNPKKVAFIPDETIIAQSHQIDISPTIDADTFKQTQKNVYFSINIGPLYNLQKAKELEKLIVNVIVPVQIVRKSKSFELYAGHFQTLEESLNAKIRLAEEYGINGFIIEIYEQDGKKFIYGR